jgi:hypothetical protein
MLLDGFRPRSVDGRGILTCNFRSLPLLPQHYTVGCGIRAEDGATLLVQSRHYASFRILGNSKDLGFNSDVAESVIREIAPIRIPYEWRLPDGSVHEVNSQNANKV